MQRYNVDRIGTVGDSGIYELNLNNITESIFSSVTVLDDRIISGGTRGASGFDLDFIVISNERLSTSQLRDAVNNDSTLQVFNFTSGVSFTPGFQQTGGSEFVNTTNTLFGTTTNNAYSSSLSTLDQLDGVVPAQSGATTSGGLSLGEGGNVTFSLTGAVTSAGRYIYIGDAGGGNDDAFIAFDLGIDDRGVDLQGTSGNDVIVLGEGVNVGTGAGNDKVDGVGGNDTISTKDGRDTLTGGPGDDTLDGGYDIDIATFTGRGGDYTVSKTGDLSLRFTGPDGTDILKGIERVSFTDNSPGNEIRNVANFLGFEADVSSVQVTAATYQFFTGAVPTKEGFEFLIASRQNANDLNDAAYEAFNQENRFINFANNLGSFGGNSSTDFKNAYGSLSFEQTVRQAYDQIVGLSEAQAQGIDTDAAINFFIAAEGFYTQVAQERVVSSGVSLDQAVKVVAVGSILNEAVKANTGKYASQVDTFVRDVFPDATSTEFGNDLFAVA